MKLIHLSDLHIGKRVNEFSMLEDQKYILTKILNIIDEEKPDAVLIAGDVYDKTTPSVEAVELLDDFLVRLAKRMLNVFIISGNHDSAERLAFAGRLIDSSGIHLSPVYSGIIEPFSFEDEFGTVNIYMLPFVKPIHVRRFFPEEETGTYTDAIATAIRHISINRENRNILVAHQFVTGAERSDSEEEAVGGLDNVDASVFEDFDYVALGHIHGEQNMSSCKIRYCGTPLKYSFSEASHIKSVSVVELGAKGSLNIRKVPLVPQRDMVEIRGTYEELTAKSFYDGTTYDKDYMHITLTDEEDIPDAMAKLRMIFYHNLMKLDYDNKRTRQQAIISGAEDIEKKTPLELFDELYEKQNGVNMSAQQCEFVAGLIKEIQEERA